MSYETKQKGKYFPASANSVSISMTTSTRHKAKQNYVNQHVTEKGEVRKPFERLTCFISLVAYNTIASFEYRRKRAVLVFLLRFVSVPATTAVTWRWLFTNVTSADHVICKVPKGPFYQNEPNAVAAVRLSLIRFQMLLYRQQNNQLKLQKVVLHFSPLLIVVRICKSTKKTVTKRGKFFSFWFLNYKQPHFRKSCSREGLVEFNDRLHDHNSK